MQDQPRGSVTSEAKRSRVATSRPQNPFSEQSSVRPALCNSSGLVQMENRESKWLASNRACSVLTRHIKQSVGCFICFLSLSLTFRHQLQRDEEEGHDYRQDQGQRQLLSVDVPGKPKRLQYSVSNRYTVEGWA